MSIHDQITALAPSPEPFDPAWSRETLARIQAEPVAAQRRRRERRAAAFVAAGVMALTAGTAVAADGPSGAVKDAILHFSRQPNTTGNGLGVLDDPVQVAQFQTRNGLFAAWIATSSNGQVCDAETNGTWDGEGVPKRSQLDYGCGAMIVDPVNPNRVIEMTRPDQFGGFFKDDDGPLIYGVSPYADAVTVRVLGRGVDRRLPIRTDSHGYGAALPEAGRAPEVRLTFFDADRRTLGSKRLVAPVG